MSVEFYGFALYICSIVGASFWLAWSFIPDSILNYFGIIYYPSKYWAATIPSLVIVTYVSWFVFYTAAVLYYSKPRHLAANCSDSFFRSDTVQNSSSLIPALSDTCIEQINREINLTKDS